jgi:hypothetical protein
MKRQARTPGGAKNEKSGKLWSKEELREVLKFYLIELKDGRGIHESNPDLIKAAKKLGRETRAFENQLRQFKDLEKNEENSTMNVGKNCKEVWKEQMEKETKDNDSLWTFSEIFEAYLRLHPELEGRENDINRFKNYIKEDFGDRTPSEVVHEDISYFEYKLQNRQLNPSTIGHVLELLQRLANYAFKKKFCPGLSFKIQIPTVENQKNGNNPALKEKVKKEPEKSNDFLSKLLQLQQDGNEAIATPWGEEPLLNVETEIDKDIEDIAENMIIGGNGNSTARWHFFIGSPGNGKSAAMRKLCKQLLEDSCIVEDVSGVSIENIDKNSTSIPYEIKIKEKDKIFHSAMIIQDASVVRDAYAQEIDPAKELLKSMKMAWEDGISLVVCTNRGVIERAYWGNYLDNDINKTEWFRVLGHIIDSEGKDSIEKPIKFSKSIPQERIKFKDGGLVKFSYLDKRSLLIEHDVFNLLLEKATKESNWNTCNGCKVSNLCPFKANRDWLADLDTREKFLSVLKRAEVFSGQILVFREAQHLISLLLAGCRLDYNQKTPCKWVSEKVQIKDVFALAMRRIYMCMFASFSPYGLEFDPELQKLQKQALDSLQKIESEHDAAQRLKHLLNKGGHPSTDVGLNRMTGYGKVLFKIDAWREGLPKELMEKWDADFEELKKSDCKHFTEIEKECASTWGHLEELIEKTSSHEAPDYYHALRRWSSNFLLHFGILLNGVTSWSKELDEYIEILKILKKKEDKRTPDERRSIDKANEQLEKLLVMNNKASEGEGFVELSHNVKLTGRWVNEKLRPRIIENSEVVGTNIIVEFLESEVATVSANAFIWMRRYSESNLDKKCFPAELFRGIIDARNRAASSTKHKKEAYAFTDNDVTLLICDSEGKEFKLTRSRGEVYVD